MKIALKSAWAVTEGREHWHFAGSEAGFSVGAMADRKENSISFSASVDSTPDRVVAVAKMFKSVISSVADDGPTGTVTMTVANREMVATMNPRDPAALQAVSQFSTYLSSPERAARTEEGRAVLNKVRDFCRNFPLDSSFQYQDTPALILDQKFWESVALALGDELTAPSIEEETFVYGRVSSVADTGKVKLHLEDGAKYTFRASEEMMYASARFFGRDVYARVTFRHEGEIKKAGELISLTEAKKEGDIVGTFERLQSSLQEAGVKVTTDWLKD